MTPEERQAMRELVVEADYIWLGQWGKNPSDITGVMEALLDDLDAADAEFVRLRERIAEYERARQAVYVLSPLLPSDGGTQAHVFVRPGPCSAQGGCDCEGEGEETR